VQRLPHRRVRSYRCRVGTRVRALIDDSIDRRLWGIEWQLKCRCETLPVSNSQDVTPPRRGDDASLRLWFADVYSRALVRR
jgi:hypothetical protein